MLIFTRLILTMLLTPMGVLVPLIKIQYSSMMLSLEETPQNFTPQNPRHCYCWDLDLLLYLAGVKKKLVKLIF